MNRIFILSIFLLLVACQEKKTAMLPPTSVAFIGTYTQKEGHVDGKGAGIYAYETGPKPEDWKLLHTFTDIINPSFLCLSPTLPIIYAVSEQGPNVPDPKSVIKVIAYDPQTCAMREIQKISAKGDAPCYISTDAEGKYVYVANYVSGNVVQYAIQKDGRLGEGIATQHIGKGPHFRQEAPHAHYVKQHPFNKKIYAVDLGTDEVIAYSKTPKGLEKNGLIKTIPGSGPRHLSWHPNGKILYLLNELTGTIETWEWTDSSVKKISATQLNNNPDSLFAGGADIHISKDGKFVYATLRGDFNEIIALKVASENFELTLIDRYPVGGDCPRNFALSPEQNYLAVGLQNSDKIMLFDRDVKSGTLGEGKAVEVKTPVCIVWKD